MIMDIYIDTISGTKVHFLDPQPEELTIEDIAHALSQQCRFNGHCAAFYSVAEHCVLVSGLLPPSKRLAGLLHDAAEAYLSDIPSPIKQFLPDYYKLEKGLEEVISSKWNVELHDPEIKQADMQQLRTEAHYLMPTEGNDWFGGDSRWLDLKPNPEFRPVCLPPPYAYKLFMETYELLTESAIVLL